MNAYYIICRSSYGNICNYMLADLTRRKDVTFIYQENAQREIKNRFIRKLYAVAVHMEWELRKTFLPGRIARNAKKMGRRPVCIITNEAMCALTASDLRRMKKCGILVTALLIDPISGKYPSAECARKLLGKFSFDKVLTFDPADAEANDWVYTNALYSAQPVENTAVTQDLFYMGNLKNRRAFCCELLEKCKENDVKASIKLLCFDAQQAKSLPAGTVLTEYVPYTQLLQMQQGAGCILDMTQSGQAGVTLRYYEAVVYNKKLLTNNPHVAKLPFYDSRYMQLYTSVDDIDWAWVKDPAMPDYGYDGRFSPDNMLVCLEQLLT